MKISLSNLCTALVVIVSLTVPYRTGAEPSPFAPGNRDKVLTTDKQHLVFTVDEKALALQSIRFELAYINAQLKNPSALISRLSLSAPKVNAKEVLKLLKQRRDELSEKLLKHVKQPSGVQKRKGNNTSPLARPYPPPPLGNAAPHMVSESIKETLKELKMYSQRYATTPPAICESRKGRITEPGHFATSEIPDRCPNSSECEGGTTYSIDDGVLHFYGEVNNEDDDPIYYIFFGQLGYKFPFPYCDSYLAWEFKLDARAGLYSDAGSSLLYLDCHTLELEDTHSELPSVPVTFAGSVLEINGNDPFKSIDPKTFSGGFVVKTRKESALFVGLFIMISANEGKTIGEGEFQIFNDYWGFAPGVRYRIEPIEKPM